MVHNLVKHMKLAHTKSNETNLDDEMSQLIKSLHTTAEQTIGYIKRSKNPNLIDDKQIQQLSERRKMQSNRLGKEQKQLTKYQNVDMK